MLEKSEELDITIIELKKVKEYTICMYGSIYILQYVHGKTL